MGYLGQAHKTNQGVEELQDFKSSFGVSPKICDIVHHLVDIKSDMGKAKMKHFLWAFHFMKEYSGESTNCGLFKEKGKAPSRKTFRKWAKEVIFAVADLEGFVVSSPTSYYGIVSNLHPLTPYLSI